MRCLRATCLTSSSRKRISVAVRKQKLGGEESSLLLRCETGLPTHTFQILSPQTQQKDKNGLLPPQPLWSTATQSH
jgi:hypothetical protein